LAAFGQPRTLKVRRTLARLRSLRVQERAWEQAKFNEVIRGAQGQREAPVSVSMNECNRERGTVRVRRDINVKKAERTEY